MTKKSKKMLIAGLLSVGIFGSLHIISSIILAIYHTRLSEVNPFYIIQINNLAPKILNNGWVEIVGWVIWLATLLTIYSKLPKD